MAIGGWTYTPQNRKPASKQVLGALAALQFGHVTWAQLRALDVSEAAISRWARVGYLKPVYPRVYVVGHQTVDEPSRLFSLILFAGPNAELSHGTAAFWRGWLRYPVQVTHVSTPRRVRARIPGVRFHGRRQLERELVDGIPCTTTTQTLLDLAATEPLKLVKRSLAQLDYKHALDDDAVRAACAHGRPGSTRLFEALTTYMPQLARTKSDLEDEYLYVCQRFGIPLPEVNAYVHGEEVDASWRTLGLMVELDGGGNHRTPAQRHRDQRKAMKLRSYGLTVVRYTEDMVFNTPEQVAADTLAQLEQRRRLGA